MSWKKSMMWMMDEIVNNSLKFLDTKEKFISDFKDLYYYAMYGCTRPVEPQEPAEPITYAEVVDDSAYNKSWIHREETILVKDAKGEIIKVMDVKEKNSTVNDAIKDVAPKDAIINDSYEDINKNTIKPVLKPVLEPVLTQANAVSAPFYATEIKDALLDNINVIRSNIDNLEKIVLNYSKAYSKVDSKNDMKLDSKIYSQDGSYSPEALNNIITLKNKYFWKNYLGLSDIIRTESGIQVADVASVIKNAMHLKTTDPKYSGIARINYDSRIASWDMKDEFIRAYISSGKSLKVIAQEFEQKYGMHISVSTISINARKYLGDQGMQFHTRREAKEYYSRLAA